MNRKQYQYAKINGHYYCLKQNPAVLVGLRYFKNGDSPIHSFSTKGLIKFILQQIHFVKRNTVIELPFFGQFCLPVHRGFKIFNLRNRSVVKVFLSEVDTAIVESEIKQVRKAGSLKIAPSVKLWNIEDRWYEEDYAEGASEYSFIISNPETLLSRYKQFIAPLVEEIIFFQAPIIHKSLEYINQVVGIMEKKKFPKFDINKVREIKKFVDFIVKKLRADGACQVRMVFTHGDFHTKNIKNTKYGLKIFDWELAEDRSLLHDFYNYFFHLLRHEMMIKDPWVLTNEALSILCLRMNLKSPNLSRHILSNAHVYRWIYYIERISAILDLRDCVPPEITMRNILHNIQVFKGFEHLNT